MGKSKVLAGLVVAGSVLSGCSAAVPNASSPSVAAASTEGDVCAEWNILVGSAQDPNDPQDLRAGLADQMAVLAGKASGTLKADIQYLADTANQAANDEIKAADQRIANTCGTVEYMETLHPDTSASAAPAATAASPDSPLVSDADVIGVQNLSLTMRGGYIANVTLKWHQYKEIDQTQFGCEAPSGTYVKTKATVVEGTVDYPVVNGFTPPPAYLALFNAGEVQPFNGELLCSSAGSSLEQLKLPTAASVAQGAGKFFLVIGAVSSTSPDNPEGTFSDFHLTTKLRAEGTSECTMDGPGTSAKDCTVSMPR
jgi:hypothetical protein